MKQRALVGETVSDFLYRIFARDDDEIERDFYLLNPTHHSPHLVAGVEYEVPTPKQIEVKDEVSEVSRWA
ncbi:phage tail protein [Vibrio sp. OCN044]|uniref:Phage tail protein n=1 Tax=Vibrio tetraodonis subsp. pristinus TaxID=2695891 RepID=A0A6L8M185_9VIBR|nr:phage tail protein [Vibrio tetraodonis]MYM61623.1 phage tail protein [Vibrio tetraodonis subsp. pristinus]